MPIAPMVDVTANQKCHEGKADFCNHIDILRLANWSLGKMADVLQVQVNSPRKGQWRGALMFSLICVWINGWVNNRKVGDLRRYRGHYDVTVMF